MTLTARDNMMFRMLLAGRQSNAVHWLIRRASLTWSEERSVQQKPGIEHDSGENNSITIGDHTEVNPASESNISLPVADLYHVVHFEHAR